MQWTKTGIMRLALKTIFERLYGWIKISISNDYRARMSGRRSSAVHWYSAHLQPCSAVITGPLGRLCAEWPPKELRMRSTWAAHVLAFPCHVVYVYNLVAVLTVLRGVPLI